MKSLLIFGVVCALIELIVSKSHSDFKFYQIFENQLLHKHGVSMEELISAVNQIELNSGNSNSAYFTCGPSVDYKNQVKRFQDVEGSIHVKPAFMKKSLNSACMLSYLPASLARELESKSEGWRFYRLPDFLKLHPSIMSYIEQIHLLAASNQIKAKHDIAKGAALTIDFLPSTLHGRSPRRLAEQYLTLWKGFDRKLDSDHRLKQSKTWNELVSRIAGNGDEVILGDMPQSCALPASLTVNYHDSGITLSNLKDFRLSCIIELVEHIVQDSTVLRVSMSTRPKLLNFEARGMMQSGERFVEPFSRAGLNGEGQVVGIADSGLNDLSCFFLDNSNAYPTITTNRTGVLEPLRRKVIQYFVNADVTDELGGHGTHVSGTVAGASDELSIHNGMAPAAKIAFYDIGMTKEEYLVVPPMNTVLFPRAHAAGARVHTNSWGDLGGLYSQTAVDVDTYAYANPDFLIIFAAGNSGQEGFQSCGAPSIAKNSLSVGCEQIHNADTDVPHAQRTVSYFSSIGPTYDGRFKPDIVAPGDFIISAFSGYPEALSNAAAGHKFGDDVGAGTVKQTCAVIQMSGTSMAAPGTAGVALLIRQYFMQHQFWASMCNRAYSSCKEGAFEPTGYFLKAIILHSGQAMAQYSVPVYDSVSRLSSRPLGPPPDIYQGYGALRLSNVLPLTTDGGLDKDLDLIVWDKLSVAEHTTLAWEVRVKPHDTKPLKITIVWYDPPGPMYASSNLLLHDIDLLVVTPAGNKFWGNGVTDGDESNPNEQVYISSPASECFGRSECVLKVLVHAHVLAEASTQNIAMIMTTSCSVAGPSFIEEPWITPSTESHTPTPTMAFQTYDLELSGTLKGGELASKSLNIPISSPLDWVDVTLEFDPLESTGTLPTDCQFIVQDPTNRAVAVGGSDLSYPPAKITTTWTNDWHAGGVTRAGTFHMSVGLRDTHLKSSGSWRFLIMNAWSKAGLVSYKLKATLKFMASDTARDPTEVPVMRPVSSPVAVATGEHAPTISSFIPFNIDIPRVVLGVREVDGVLQVPRVELATFEHRGVLRALQLTLNDNKEVSNYGFYCHSFAVIITAPDGRQIQLGGHYEWFGVSDRFYRRNLPDTWYSRPSNGQPWVAYRDVTAAGVDGSAPGVWRVEVALGYDVKPLQPLDYSGAITVYFDDAAGSSLLWTVNLSKPTKEPSVTRSPHRHSKAPTVEPVETSFPFAEPISAPTISRSHAPTDASVISDISGKNVSIAEYCVASAMLFGFFIFAYFCCFKCKRTSTTRSLSYVELPTTNRMDMEALTTQSKEQSYGSIGKS